MKLNKLLSIIIQMNEKQPKARVVEETYERRIKAEPWHEHPSIIYPVSEVKVLFNNHVISNKSVKPVFDLYFFTLPRGHFAERLQKAHKKADKIADKLNRVK